MRARLWFSCPEGLRERLLRCGLLVFFRADLAPEHIYSLATVSALGEALGVPGLVPAEGPESAVALPVVPPATVRARAGRLGLSSVVALVARRDGRELGELDLYVVRKVLGSN